MRERLLLQLDVGAAGAVLRIALGLAFAASLRQVAPDAGWGLAAACLAVLLFGVKAAGAVARGRVGATPRVRACWAWRRELAAYHDSYQVRKLLWVGAGILAAARMAGPASGWEAGLGGVCVVAGLAAEGWWRRKGLALDPPVTP